MRKMTQLIALVSATVLLLCSCSQPQSKTEITVTTSLNGKPVLVGNIPSSFPLVDDDTSLNILFSRASDIGCENVYVWQKYEEMTGVHVNWTTIPKEKRKEIANTILANRQDYDLLLRCKLSSTLLAQYGESGYIYDLAKDDMLSKNAPNCYAFLQAHPQALASITNPDGTIYALPQINSGAELCVSRKIFINKHWLERLGLSIPKTTEEFYEMLKAFKEQDANGNGNPNDEIPLSSQDWDSIAESLMGSYGLCNRGILNNFIDYDSEADDVRILATSDRYLSYLEYCNRLYSEELLDNYIFTINLEQWTNRVLQDSIGVFSNTNLATMPTEQADDWITMDEPLEGPYGDKMWAAIRPDFHSTGAAVIPAACENPELVLRWLDYFWTDEGTLFYHMGIEGDTFTVNEDGSYDYSDRIYEEIDSSKQTFDSLIATYSPYPGGNNPTVEIAPYFAGGEMAELPASAAKSLYEYRTKEFWPCFTFTSEENEILNTKQTDITKYIQSSTIQFISGERPLSDWETYVEQINHFGSEEVLGVYRNAVQRYENLIAQNEKSRQAQN